MADSYLTISWIVTNQSMRNRVTACASQQAHLGSAPAIPDETKAPQWVADYAWVWASSPGWAEKWDYALNTHEPEPPVDGVPQMPYDPGADLAVITDADILATVQALAAA